MPEYTNSNMVVYTALSPNHNNGRVHSKYNPTGKITKITPHYCAGNCTIETIGRIFAPEKRQASSNYGIGSDGRVGMYCEEKDRPWTSSSPANDYCAVTIEVANLDNKTGEITEAAWHSLIALCTDICRRNGIDKLDFTGNANGTLTYHSMFAATACPGPWLKERMPDLARAVNALLHPVAPPTPTPSAGTYVVHTALGGYYTAANALAGTNRVNMVNPGTYHIFRVAGNAINVTTKEGCPGSWINGTLNVAPAPTPAPTPKPEPTAAAPLSLTEVAKQVIRGDWGNGDTRRKRLKDAHYIYSAVQSAVNAILTGKSVPNIAYYNGQAAAPAPAPVPAKKTNEQIAKEVIRGDWGNGEVRKQKLTAAGYSYSAVMTIVNRLLK